MVALIEDDQLLVWRELIRYFARQEPEYERLIAGCRPARLEASDDGVVVQLLPSRTVKPQFVGHDLSAKICGQVVSLDQRVSQSNALRSQRGVDVVALKVRTFIRGGIGAVKVVTSRLHDGIEHHTRHRRFRIVCE